MKVIKCVVACHGGDGPAFVPVNVEVDDEKYDDGDHYDIAKEAAADQGWDGPMVVFDENDGPGWLFSQFDWDKTEVWE